MPRKKTKPPPEPNPDEYLDVDPSEVEELSASVNLSQLTRGQITSDFGSGWDGDEYTVELGNLRVGMSYEQHRALLYVMLCNHVGKPWSRILLAILDRLPCDLHPKISHVHVLWAAVASFQDEWPNRMGGYDDRVWGVPAPTGVTPHLYLGKGKPFREHDDADDWPGSSRDRR